MKNEKEDGDVLKRECGFTLQRKKYCILVIYIKHGFTLQRKLNHRMECMRRTSLKRFVHPKP